MNCVVISNLITGKPTRPRLGRKGGGEKTNVIFSLRLNFTFNNSPPRSLPHGHAWVATSGLETFGASLPTKQLVSCGEARRHEKSPPSPTASLVSPPAGPARPLRRTRHARRGQPSAESLATPSHRSTFARWTCAVRFLLPPYPRQEQCSLESSGPFLSRMP